MANRGIVFIDEINRLAETAPEITDVLLSLMGTKPGKIKIEEVGLEPWEIHVSSSVWAASNPDEDPGPWRIRRQLSDRFDVVVPVHRPSDPRWSKALLSRSLSRHQAVRAQTRTGRHGSGRRLTGRHGINRHPTGKHRNDLHLTGITCRTSDKWASYGSSWDRRPMWVRKLRQILKRPGRSGT